HRPQRTADKKWLIIHIYFQPYFCVFDYIDVFPVTGLALAFTHDAPRDVKAIKSVIMFPII
ncbi:MAG: hypothetical protein ACKVG6_13300, partial [Alphaproteobacteria bacterium]